MSGLSFRFFSYMLLIVLLIWSSNFETCIARRGKHWRQSRTVAASLSKKKGNSHGNSHNQHGGGGSSSHSKPKPPPPTHKKTPSSPPFPKPKVDPPSTPPSNDYNGGSSTMFNVLDFGAKGDGRTDDTKVTNSLSLSLTILIKLF